MIAYFDRFTIEMTKSQAEKISHPGPCDQDVKELLLNKNIQKQLKKISTEDLIAELKEFGAWTTDELNVRSDNEARIIWTAGGEIAAK